MEAKTKGRCEGMKKWGGERGGRGLHVTIQVAQIQCVQKFGNERAAMQGGSRWEQIVLPR